MARIFGTEIVWRFSPQISDTLVPSPLNADIVTQAQRELLEYITAGMPPGFSFVGSALQYYLFILDWAKMMSQNALLGLWLSSLVATLASPQPHLTSLIESGSSTLNWKPCDLDLSDEIKAVMRERGYCATLEVPLDYTNPQSDKTVELQLIRFNATKEPFKGSVLWNPGGPGISGIETFATLGPDFRE